MKLEELYFLDDSTVLEVIKLCEDEDLFNALIVQANDVLERLKFCLKPEIYNRVKRFQTHPLLINPADIKAAQHRIESVMEKVISKKS